MARTDPDEGDLLTESDFTATREGRWYIVRRNGQMFAKRYTRDESFTSVWILFNSNQSPAHRKTEANLETDWNGRQYINRVIWRGAWRNRPSSGFGYNRLEIPVTRD